MKNIFLSLIISTFALVGFGQCNCSIESFQIDNQSDDEFIVHYYEDSIANPGGCPATDTSGIRSLCSCVIVPAKSKVCVYPCTSGDNIGMVDIIASNNAATLCTDVCTPLVASLTRYAYKFPEFSGNVKIDGCSGNEYTLSFTSCDDCGTNNYEFDKTVILTIAP